MSNVVTKGTNRPAAAAKRTKHAQRTPLPPRAGQIEAAKEGEPEIGVQYGKMTAAQLREKAIGLGLTPPKSASKGQLLDAILAAERSERAQKRLEEAEPAVEEGKAEPKGFAKAERMTAEMAKSGWDSRVTSAPAGRTVATATRGPEVITITWDTGVFNYEESRYLIGDRIVRPRNVSQARQWAARPADQATAELARVTANRAFRKREPKEATAPTARLPFDPDNATTQEVWAALAGKKITWYNRHSRSTESAVLTPAGRDFFKLSEVAGEYVIQFLGIDGKIKGFRACRLKAIQRIGR